MKIQYVWSLIILSSLMALGACTTVYNHRRPTPGDPLSSLIAELSGTEPGRIVDSTGRQVLLRGVNVNSHVEYWQYDPDIPTNFPLTENFPLSFTELPIIIMNPIADGQKIPSIEDITNSTATFYVNTLDLTSFNYQAVGY